MVNPSQLPNRSKDSGQVFLDSYDNMTHRNHSFRSHVLWVIVESWGEMTWQLFGMSGMLIFFLWVHVHYILQVSSIIYTQIFLYLLDCPPFAVIGSSLLVEDVEGKTYHLQNICGDCDDACSH